MFPRDVGGEQPILTAQGEKPLGSLTAPLVDARQCRTIARVLGKATGKKDVAKCVADFALAVRHRKVSAYRTTRCRTVCPAH